MTSRLSRKEELRLYTSHNGFTDEELELALEAAAYILIFRKGEYNGWSASDTLEAAGVEPGSLREQQILTAANLIAGGRG